MATRKISTTTKKTTARKTNAKKATATKTPAKKTTAKRTNKKLSQIDAVLKKARKPMSCKEMVEAMAKQKLWTSPGGKTPDATLWASNTSWLVGKTIGPTSNTNWPKKSNRLNRIKMR
ncbi:MAG: HTH domain-containing protein [Rhodopirellula sp. JB044]|uniref:HTH domain-containing protein n=1 Tax=Rhodopirellula sp. JB044 TaxID=3342844 RepID=UPI00370A454B